MLRDASKLAPQHDELSVKPTTFIMLRSPLQGGVSKHVRPSPYTLIGCAKRMCSSFSWRSDTGAGAFIIRS